MQSPQEDTPGRPPMELNSTVRQTLNRRAGTMDHDHNVQASGGSSPQCMVDMMVPYKHNVDPQWAVRPRTTQGQPHQVNTAQPYESPLLATMQPAATTPSFGQTVLSTAGHARASSIQPPPTTVPTPSPPILSPIFNRYDVPDSIQTPTAMVQGHPLLIQGPTTTTPDRTAIIHAPTPIPLAQSTRYVPPLQTHHLPDGMHASEFLMPTGHSQVTRWNPPASVPAPPVSINTPVSGIYDAAPSTMPDPKAIVHGAAASLPVPSSHPPGMGCQVGPTTPATPPS
uniref:mucin-2-like n=1 Tax=Epinephelus lanceolatus TaxID=310571 RepID=UPI0014461702|nr:mucin-2-like [Epinephelus lanceolatus]